MCLINFRIKMFWVFFLLSGISCISGCALWPSPRYLMSFHLMFKSIFFSINYNIFEGNAVSLALGTLLVSNQGETLWLYNKYLSEILFHIVKLIFLWYLSPIFPFKIIDNPINFHCLPNLYFIFLLFVCRKTL